MALREKFPIFCLENSTRDDERVEIAEGLFLGQLIYSTVPLKPFHTPVGRAEYKYLLFSYFLLLDKT